jgi:DUF4097 and DUF4098 domain-containing protein YvlB
VTSSGSSGSVRIHAILKAQNDWFGSGDVKKRIEELERNPPVEQTGSRVRIGYVQDRDLLRGISMHLEIQTPLDTQLRARADSGGIRVEGIKGPVDCKTDSGGIRIHDVKANVHAEADSGGIHLDNIAGAVVARVDSGGIEATDVAGEIDAQDDSGSIRLSQTTAAPIRAKSDSGGITVRLAPHADYDLSVESGSGHISVPEMTVRSGFSSHHLEGKVGKGGPLVKISVDSGSATVE